MNLVLFYHLSEAGWKGRAAFSLAPVPSPFCYLGIGIGISNHPGLKYLQPRLKTNLPKLFGNDISLEMNSPETHPQVFEQPVIKSLVGCLEHLQMSRSFCAVPEYSQMLPPRPQSMLREGAVTWQPGPDQTKG